MTKNDFLVVLGDELRKKGIADVHDILSEHEEHFAFKMADGYSE